MASPNSGATLSTVSFGICLFGRQRDRVGEDQAVDGGLLQPLDRAAHQQAVRGGQEDLPGAVLVHHFGRAADRAGRADHVVEDQGHAAFDLAADDVGLLGLLGAAAALVDDGQVAAQPGHVGQGPLDAPLVRADHHEIVVGEVHRLEVLVDHRGGVEVVDGDVEKALDLGGVQVHRQHAVGAGAGDQVGHQLGRDRHAAFVLAVLPGVAEIGNDGRDPIGAGPLEALDHDQQFHEVFVDRRAGGLDDEHVAAADVLVDLAGDFAVGEIAHHRPAQRQAQVLANSLGQGRMGTSGEEFHGVHGKGIRGWEFWGKMKDEG